MILIMESTINCMIQEIQQDMYLHLFELLLFTATGCMCVIDFTVVADRLKVRVEDGELLKLATSRHIRWN